MLSSFMIRTRTGAVPALSNPSNCAARRDRSMNSIPGERAAIVDANLQRTAVLQVGHLDDAGQLQGLMRRADLGQIENLAVRG